MFRKLAPALVAPLLLASACAHQASQDAVRVITAAPLAALQSAPDRAADAGTVRFEMTLAIADPSGDTPSLSATGATDLTNGRSQIRMDLAGIESVLGRDAPKGLDQPMEMVVDGDVIYLRIPFLADITGTTTWLSASAEDLGQGADLFGSGVGSADPAHLLDALRGVADDVHADGHDDVRGVPTTRYTATLDLRRAVSEAPAELQGRLRAQLDELGGLAPKLPVEVWVDADGLARRLTMSLGDQAVGGEMRVEFFDYGKPVDITVPSPDDVTPFLDALGSMAKAFTDEPA